MCGIYWELCTREPNIQFNIYHDEKLRRCLECRGPDSTNSITISLKFGEFERRALFYGTVLWMQGDTPTRQPVESTSGILVYNGDIFDNGWKKNISDTMQLMDRLDGTATDAFDDRKMNILRVINKLTGPFSIIYYNKTLRMLFFARDTIGRNSLLCYNDENSVIISSVLGRKYGGTVEIPASHMYTIDLEDLTISNYDRSTLCNIKTSSIESWLTNLQEIQSLPDDFSNEELDQPMTTEPEDTELIAFIEEVASCIKCRREAMNTLLRNDKIGKIVQNLMDLLKESVRIRLETQPHKCNKCVSEFAECSGHCTVGILFSGGLDCSILALLADEFVPKDEPIDLINVAFKRGQSGSFDVPDRLTGRLAVEELKALRPARQWSFREVDVCEEELRREQDSTIADLVYPRRTVLDESLGSALWFAGRAADASATSSCRVLLVGSGADELFGGYARHRSALRRGGWCALARELRLDWRRISARNLARDNRVLAHHARQPRLPYLDERFLAYALRLRPWERCVPSTACEPGFGDKLFLRLTAFQLGLMQVSSLPKRALQFGSRIANKKENGSDLSERFRNINISGQNMN